MIYINQNEDRLVTSVWFTESNLDAEQLFREQMKEKAEELGIIINPHWLNMMNHENHHQYLTKSQYNKLSKEWVKIRKKSGGVESVIKNQLGGVKVEFKVY